MLVNAAYRMIRCRAFALLSAMILPVLVVSGCGKESVPEKSLVRPVKAIKMLDQVQMNERRFPGRAKATQEIDLSFRVDGPLITRPVNIGSEVKRGDVVARIDPRDYEVQLRSAEGELRNARATLQRATADYQRSANIFKEDPGAISQSAVDRALENRDRARAAVDSLVATVQAAKDALSYTTLQAPFDGAVVATYVENFQDVRAKQPVVRIVDDSKVEMVINIPESLIALTPEVKDIRVEFDPFPGRVIPAEIKEIGTEASTTTRTYPVTLIMDQPEDFKILSGMAGRAWGTPPTSFSGAAHAIPVAAVFSDTEGGPTYVWVIDDQAKTVTKREVTAGELTARGIQIKGGLDPGEWIAVAGVHYLREGQQVSILSE